MDCGKKPRNAGQKFVDVCGKRGFVFSTKNKCSLLSRYDSELKRLREEITRVSGPGGTMVYQGAATNFYNVRDIALASLATVMPKLCAMMR